MKDDSMRARENSQKLKFTQDFLTGKPSSAGGDWYRQCSAGEKDDDFPTAGHHSPTRGTHLCNDPTWSVAPVTASHLQGRAPKYSICRSLYKQTRSAYRRSLLIPLNVEPQYSAT
ncbi:MAG: hypothetical protein ACO1Q7_00395 [Gemmatimonas sp.]